MRFVLLVGLLALMACSGHVAPRSKRPTELTEPQWLADEGAVRLTTVPRKVHALLIGIGHYPAETGWEPLHAHNDVALMQTTLLRQGFRPEQVKVLSNEQATRAKIEQAFRQLIDSVQSGSAVVIHYSGHARQLPDDNRDEADGYDEALAPVDAPLLLTPETITQYIRDDQLANWIDAVRKRVGPTGQVWLVFDACHSATLHRMSRLRAGQRGLPTPLTHTRPPAPTDADWYGEIHARHQPALAPYVLFAASAEGQPSYEYTDASGRTFGPLTLAVCSAMERLAGVITYSQLFADVLSQLHTLSPYQKPALEGAAQQLVVGHRETTLLPFRSDLKSGDQGAVVVQAGRMRGLSVGDQIGFYPPGTYASTRKPAALPGVVRGTVVQTDALYARVQLPEGASVSDLQQHTAHWLTQQAPIGTLRERVLATHQTHPDFQCAVQMQRIRLHDGRVDTLQTFFRSLYPSFGIVATERAVLTLQNTGFKPFYATVLDVLPDGCVTVLLPEPGHSPESYRLLPGQILRRRIRLTEPAGLEIYKLLLTPDPLDLRTGGLLRGQTAHPYQYLFNPSAPLRGNPLALDASSALPVGAGATREFAFWVLKP